MRGCICEFKNCIWSLMHKQNSESHKQYFIVIMSVWFNIHCNSDFLYRTCFMSLTWRLLLIFTNCCNLYIKREWLLRFACTKRFWKEHYLQKTYNYGEAFLLWAKELVQDVSYICHNKSDETGESAEIIAAARKHTETRYGLAFFTLFNFSFWWGRGVEMVIGWICSRDVFGTSWESLHEVLPILIAEERRMFTWVLSLPQWRC